MKLRKLKLKDAPLIQEWMVDVEINQYFKFDDECQKLGEIEKFIKKSWEDQINLHFAITNDLDEYLGTVSLKNYDKKNKTSEYAISLRKSCHGTGVGKVGSKAILKYGFEELNLNRIYLNVLSDNKRAIKFYEKFGFVYEGEFKEYLFLGNEFKSLKWYRILKSEYFNKR